MLVILHNIDLDSSESRNRVDYNDRNSGRSSRYPSSQDKNSILNRAFTSETPRTVLNSPEKSEKIPSPLLTRQCAHGDSEEKNGRIEFKMVISTLGLVIIFFISWLPFLISGLISAFNDEKYSPRLTAY